MSALPLAVEKYRGVASDYDRRTRRLAGLRERAVETLRLRSGDTAIDVACGTGVNFTTIEDRVGPAGTLVGLDVSADMLRLARHRVALAGWQNVKLIEAPIESATIPPAADAALLSLAHDVMVSAPALDNLLASLKPGARIVAWGAKRAASWNLPVNLYVSTVARRYVTNFEDFDRPWRRLAQRVPDLAVQELAFGGAYMASGVLRGAPS